MATQPTQKAAAAGDNPWITSIDKDADGNLRVSFQSAKGQPRKAVVADVPQVQDALDRWQNSGKLVRADRLILADHALSGFAKVRANQKKAAAARKQKAKPSLTPEMVAERAAKYGKQARLEHEAKLLAEHSDDGLVYFGLITLTTIGSLFLLSL